MTEHQEQPGRSAAGGPDVDPPVEAERGPTDHFAHPDRMPLRGNPEVEQVDVDRGRGKLERISGH